MRPAVQYHPGVHLGQASPARQRQPAAPANRAAYTFAHAGRQIRLGPIAFWIVVGTLVIMAVWSITTATYFAFREDVLTRLIARQAEMQFGYEDRIAEMRTQVDRMSSRQLLDQEQFEHKLDQILRRQSALEQRATTLNMLPDPSVTGTIKPTARSESTRGLPVKPSPMSGTTAAPLPQGRRAAIGVDTVLAKLSTSLDRVEAQQTGALQAMEASFDAKTRRIRGVLGELGMDSRKIAGDAVGGPFIAARLRGDADPFDRQVYKVAVARAQLDRLTRTLDNVPVRRPVMGEPEPSSGFGMRIDPFNRQPAMHTGMDMKGDRGDAVRATANGTVTTAGWQGGYGKMIEIDHGNGLATRYGHLSAFDVQVGAKIKTGQIIGRVGSTGRSTGPHLHYETRIGGEAVDPQRFLRAGAKLGTLQ